MTLTVKERGVVMLKLTLVDRGQGGGDSTVDVNLSNFKPLVFLISLL